MSRPITIGKQSERVEHHDQGRTFVHRDRGTDPEAENCRRHQHGDDAEAYIDVLSNDGFRAPAEADRKGEMRQLSLDSKKARRELEWIPSMDIKDGLKTVVKFFEDNPNGKL